MVAINENGKVLQLAISETCKDVKSCYYWDG